MIIEFTNELCEMLLVESISLCGQQYNYLLHNVLPMGVFVRSFDCVGKYIKFIIKNKQLLILSNKHTAENPDNS